MNSVTLLGRLGKDPEVRYTSAGKAVVNFSIATDESYKNTAGEKVKKTAWHRCQAWGVTGENIAKFFKKGGLILVQGKIVYTEWPETEKYPKRTSTEINVFQFHFAGDNGAGSGAGSGAAAQETSAQQEIADEDIPF